MIAIYSALVDNATHYYTLDCQDAAPPANVIKYPEVELLESISPDIFAFVYPSNTSYPSPKHKQTLEVPLRYQRIHFTVV